MKKRVKKEWTVMFYFASDNPLAPGIVSQMKALKEAGFHQDANVIARFDPHVKDTPTHIFEVNLINKLEAPGEFQGVFTSNDPYVRTLVADKLWGDEKLHDGERIRDRIQKDLDRIHINNGQVSGAQRNGLKITRANLSTGNGNGRLGANGKIKYDPPELPQEMSREQSPKDSLSSFLEFCRVSYPAHHYMLFILGHGVVVGNDLFLFDEDTAGFESATRKGDKRKKGADKRGQATSEAFLRLKDLGEILRKFKKEIKNDGQLEFIGFHSCSMSGLEVAYELQGTASYMLASQGPAFVGSWPYRQILLRLFNDLSSRSLVQDDLKDAVGLAKKLKAGKDEVSSYLRQQLPAATIKLLNGHNEEQPASQKLLDALVEGLNAVLDDSKLYQAKRFQSVRLSKTSRQLIGQPLDEKALRHLNRLLLVETYPEEISRINVKRMLKRIFYYCLYNSYDFQLVGYSYDICLCDLNKVQDLTVSLKRLSSALSKGLEAKTGKRAIELVLLAHWEAQSFWQESYTDLYDFCLCLSRRCRRTGTVSQEAADTLREIQNACREVRNALEKETGKNGDKLVINSGFAGPAYQYSHGLSLYFPWSEPLNSEFWKKEYASYKFKKTGWAKFLNQYFEVTKRQSRGSEESPKKSTTRSGLDEDLLEEITSHIFNESGQLGKGGGNDATGDPGGGKGGGNDPTGDDCNCPSIKNYPTFTRDRSQRDKKERVSPTSSDFFDRFQFD